ncbi:MAG: 23S rRNA (cytidine(2498)-2'-O)-methyltransferase RlmM [Casimicrobiaceae bacterium]
MHGVALVAQCRAGFEGEAATDLRRIAAHAAVTLEVATAPASGYVIARVAMLDRHAWERAETAVPPIFARSVFTGLGPVALLPATAATRADRVTPLLAAMTEVAEPPPWRSVWIEFPDTNDGKELSSLGRALGSRVEGALRAESKLHADAKRRLHVFLTGGGTAFVGTSDAQRTSWPMGIPRLRKPAGAASRSTLKLAEAFLTFLGDRESALLRPGLRAVDLGAAPGGWTWQLAQRGLHVTAVDNGPLKGAVTGDPLVTHLREDGLRWRPRRPVDWVTCDIVEQPLPIAEMMARWIAEGAARRAIFNLKLPMKKRYDEVRRCEQRIGEILSRAKTRYTLRVRQLYHDREEVTAYLAAVD